MENKAPATAIGTVSNDKRIDKTPQIGAASD
jgi:hypothetical protein